MTDLEQLTGDYWRAVERVRRMRVPERERLLVLADLEVLYRRQRASRGQVLPEVLPARIRQS